VDGVRTARETDGPQTRPAEFEEFARRERAALVAFAWSLTGSAGAAEEIAQEALVAAWRSWDLVGGYDKPGAWARRVVANRASNHRRSAGRESRAVERLGATSSADVVLPEADDELWAAVRRLPDRQAQVVSLYYLEDRSVADTAAILDCAEGTVKAHLHKARLALAKSLGLLGAAVVADVVADPGEEDR
jgi:RNA polymerase sigma-70 factor (ECF subfamily)